MKSTAWTWSVLLLVSAGLLASACGCKEQPTASITGAKALAPDTSAKTPEPVAKVVAVSDDALKKLGTKFGVPAVAVPRLAKAPKIDGVLDASYAKATPVTLKFLSGGDAKPTAKTTAWVVSTDKDLVFFVKCESPEMDALLAEVHDHDGQVWNDDCVELFIDPTNRRAMDGYMHLMINSIGTTAEAKGPAGSEDFSWDPKLRVKTARDKKAWTVELAIPFADMVPAGAKLNKAWAVNINRMAYLLEGTEDTAWSPTQTTSSHVPDKFGLLWLAAGKVDNTK